MTAQAAPHLRAIVERATALLGKDAAVWLSRENRNLASVAPFEMAQSAAGALIVLRELERICCAEAGR